MSEEERMLTVSDVAERLAINPATVRRWLRRKELAGYQFGGEWRIKLADLEAFIERHRVQGEEE